MRRWWVAVAASLGLVSGMVPGAASASEPTATSEHVVVRTTAAATHAPRHRVPQLRRRGRWLVDQHGRVVIVHGFNLVWKLKPYAPPATKAGFLARDAAWLHRYGFDGVRLGTLWAGLTPKSAGTLDPTYLRRVQRVMDLLDARGIWMQLDMHQDQWHETYGGEGVPDWAVHRPAPYSSAPPVTAPFPTGYWLPELSTLFDNFWANDDHLLTDWTTAWRLAARHWRHQPHLMGYDVLNEPWMGVEWPTCLTDGCPSSYRIELQPAMERATRAIRTVDRHNIVWWEPQQFAGGQKISSYFTAMKGERQLGFSWHNYCPQVFLQSQGVPGSDVEKCLVFSRFREHNALRQARRMHAAPMMSEWGATDTIRAVELDAQAADESLMGWTHWAYKRWQDPTTADTSQGMFTDDARLSSVKRAKLRTLVRTYPQATAGIPLRLRFDDHTGAFSYTYRPDRRIHAPTDVFVSPLHYPHGYRVRVTHGRVARRAGSHLLVRPTGAGRVTVRITRR